MMITTMKTVSVAMTIEGAGGGGGSEEEEEEEEEEMI